jgi:hypothetical protein
MRRAVLLLVVGLLLLGAVAPGLEALAACPQTCTGDDANGGCSYDVCCSCCLHTGPAALGSPTHPAMLPYSATHDAQAAGRVLSADPQDLLHVPKFALL